MPQSLISAIGLVALWRWWVMSARGHIAGIRSKALDPIDLARDLKSEHFHIVAERFTFPIGKFLQQIRKRGMLATLKHREAYAVGHSATHIDHVGQMPGI